MGKGLEKNNMPRTGDVMVYKKDSSLSACADFDAQIQVLDIPGEIKVGYSPIGFVRCGRAACRVSKVLWKIGKETGGKKMEEPHSLKSNEMAQVNFVPQQPLVVDTFELRGPVAHRLPGWQRCGHAWQDREEDGQDGGGQGQEVSDFACNGTGGSFLHVSRLVATCKPGVQFRLSSATCA